MNGQASLGAQRLRQFRESKKLSRQQLADLLGVHHNQIQKLETGERKFTEDWMERIAPHLGVKPRDFLVEAMPSKQSDTIVEVDGAEYARLPVFDIRFAAGAGSLHDDEQPIDHYLMSVSWLRSLTRAPLHHIRVFQADGDSMEPTINNRDWVFVDTSRTKLTNPGIYALNFEGDGLLKRAAQHLETGEVDLISDNPRYKVMTIKKPDRLIVIGRVFLSIRKH